MDMDNVVANISCSGMSINLTWSWSVSVDGLYAAAKRIVCIDLRERISRSVCLFLSTPRFHVLQLEYPWIVRYWFCVLCFCRLLSFVAIVARGSSHEGPVLLLWNGIDIIIWFCGIIFQIWWGRIRSFCSIIVCYGRNVNGPMDGLFSSFQYKIVELSAEINESQITENILGEWASCCLHLYLYFA